MVTRYRVVLPDDFASAPTMLMSPSIPKASVSCLSTLTPAIKPGLRELKLPGLKIPTTGVVVKLSYLSAARHCVCRISSKAISAGGMNTRVIAFIIAILFMALYSAHTGNAASRIPRCGFVVMPNDFKCVEYTLFISKSQKLCEANLILFYSMGLLIVWGGANRREADLWKW